MPTLATGMFEEVRSAAPRKTNYTKIALQVAVIGLLVVAIAYFMRKYSADISNLRELSFLNVAIIGVWSIASYTAYAYAVYIVLVDLGLKKLGLGSWLKIYFVSRLVNFFITQGGNLYRLIILKKNYGFSYTNSVGVTGFMIWSNATAAVLASVIALASTNREYLVGGLGLLQWCLLLFVALMIVPLIAIPFADKRLMSGLARFRLFRPLLEIAEFFVATVRKRSLFSVVTILSVIHFFFSIGMVYFTFRAIGQDIDVVTASVFTTAFVFTRYINVVPGNLGVSELVGGLLSEQMGVGFSNGLIVTGILRVVEILIILLAGAFYGKAATFSWFSRR